MKSGSIDFDTGMIELGARGAPPQPGLCMNNERKVEEPDKLVGATSWGADNVMDRPAGGNSHTTRDWIQGLQVKAVS
jgi:hypothetical protein